MHQACDRLDERWLVTRGVLFDIARLREPPYLDPGTPTYAEDLDSWQKKVGVRLERGDALLLRTDHWLRRDELRPWLTMDRIAGPMRRCFHG
jgi:hypothetical protein